MRQSNLYVKYMYCTELVIWHIKTACVLLCLLNLWGSNNHLYSILFWNDSLFKNQLKRILLSFVLKYFCFSLNMQYK